MSVVRNERIKLTATYLNAAAGGAFTAGVVAPMAAAVFGLTGPAGSLSVLTLLMGVTTPLCASGTLHMAARRILKDLDHDGH